MECRHRGGCWQEAYDEGLCYYHAKVDMGLINGPEVKKPPIRPSDVVSQERTELALLLRAMGAGPDVVKKAFTTWRRRR